MIKICSRRRLRELLNERQNQLDCVILSEPNNEDEIADLLLLCKSYVHVSFHDVIQHQDGCILPNEDHIKQILKWSKDKSDIYVACRAGVSRSSAVAYLLGCNKNIFEGILNPDIHIPNTLILEIGQKLIGDHIMPYIFDFYEEVNKKYVLDQTKLISCMWKDFTPRIIKGPVRPI